MVKLVLKNESIIIEGEQIDGFFKSSDSNEIDILNVYDEKLAYIKDGETEMFEYN